MENKNISFDFIRGLVVGEGCFTFSSITYKGHRNCIIPAFILSMSSQDHDLVLNLKNILKIKGCFYEYPPRNQKDGYKRQGKSILIVRDVGQLKNIIVPLFYKKLNGFKSVQFLDW